MSTEAWISIQDSCDARLLGPMDIKGKGQIEVVEVYDLREPPVADNELYLIDLIEVND